MHELSVAMGIVQTVSEQASANGFPTVSAVHVRVGSFAGIVCDALSFSWDLATEGTPLAGASLVIDRVPLVVSCARCQRTEQLTSTLALPCPTCGAASRDIVSGRELQIVAIEVPDEDPRDRNQSVDPQQERQARSDPTGALRT